MFPKIVVPPKTPKWINPHHHCFLQCHPTAPSPNRANEHPQSLISPFQVVDSPGLKLRLPRGLHFLFCVSVSRFHQLIILSQSQNHAILAHFNARAVNMTINVQICCHSQCLKGMKGGSFPKPSRFPPKMPTGLYQLKTLQPFTLDPRVLHGGFKLSPASLVQTVPWKMEQRSCKEKGG